MNYIAISIGAIIAVGILFRVLTLTRKLRSRPTAADIADKIDRHLQGSERLWDWEDFTTIPLRDERLEAIRRRCNDLDSVPPEERVRELNRIVEQLRSQKL